MKWIKTAFDGIRGKTAKEQQQFASDVFAEHEARDHFAPQEALNRLSERMPRERAQSLFAQYCLTKIKPVILAALEDGLISPDEEARIEAVRSRYGNVVIDEATLAKLDSAKQQFSAWSTPLTPLDVPLMLKKGEWCAHAVKAEALEEREKTVRINYSGPQARVRLAKGIYYSAGSTSISRQTERYHHSFGQGVLSATNKRLMWISPQKSISIPLDKVIQFEPFTDGVRIFKDTGKPLLFIFPTNDKIDMVRICRVIEELRD